MCLICEANPRFNLNWLNRMIDSNDNFVHPGGREVASDVGVKAKSPVSLLQEVYVRRGMTPQYDLVQVEGEVHQPTFKYRVTVGRTLATGCGHSKKKAKHCAAKIMLDKLKHLEQPADSSCSQPPIPELSSEVLSPYEDCVEGNPVGSLQELCGARRWPPPVYLLTQGEEGAVVFTLDCVIKVSLCFTSSLFLSKYFCNSLPDLSRHVHRDWGREQ